MSVSNFGRTTVRSIRNLLGFTTLNTDIPARGVGSGSDHPYTIVVEGNIGSGKTTFLNNFAKHQDVEVIEEPVQKWRDCQGHNLLGLMYEDPKRWSLLFQTYVQLTMLQQHTKPSNASVRIMERSLLSARYCFVENLYSQGKMADAEYAVLSEWFNYLVTCPTLDFKVDLIVYLRTDPEVAFQRIKERKRAEENLIPFEYLRDLHSLHEDWLVHKTKFQPTTSPVMVIDANEDLSVLAEKYGRVEEVILKNAPRFQGLLLI